MFDLHPRNPFDFRLQGQQIVVHRRFLVAAIEFDDDDEQSGLLHFPICGAAAAQKFGAAHLEKGEIIAVVKNAHLVGFGIANADLNLMGSRNGFLRWGHGVVEVLLGERVGRPGFP